jgi:hypothetical protein
MRNSIQRNLLGFRPYTNNKFLGTITLEDLSITGDCTITGDLTVNGTTTSISTNNITIEDVAIKVNCDNAANATDGCIYSQYNDGSTRYTGLFNDASDSNRWKLFKNLVVEPTGTVDTGDASFQLADLTLGGLTASSLTDGTLSVSSGAVTSLSSISDGTAEWKSNSLSGFTSISGTTLTDGTLSISSAAVTSLSSISDGTATWSSNSLSGFTSISGTTLTDGTASLSSGALTSLSTLGTCTGTFSEASDTSFQFDADAGFAANQTISVYSCKYGKHVFISFTSKISASEAGASTTPIISSSALGSAYRPASDKYFPVFVTDDGSAQTAPGMLKIDTSGIFTFYLDGASTGFTQGGNDIGWNSSAVNYYTG